MKNILKNTHQKENIELLRVRDYYFDKARKLKRLLVYFPAILMVASYFSWLPAELHPRVRFFRIFRA